MLKSAQVTTDYMGKSGPAELAVYFQHRLRELVAAGREAQDIAREAGLTGGQISGLMNYARGLGFKTYHGMLRVLHMTEEQARAAADAFVKSHPEAMNGRRVAREDAVVVRESRYPNFDKAAAFYLADGGVPAAVEQVRGTALKSESDLLPSEWLSELKVAERRLKSEARDPVGTSARDAAAKAKGDAEDTELRAKVARGETAQPGYRERLAKVKAGKKGK